MNLTEIKQKYVIELNNNPNINSEVTIESYKSIVSRFCKKHGRVYRLSVDELKEYLSRVRKDYSNSYYNAIGSALKILYRDVLKQPRKMDWFKPVKTKRKFFNIITWDEFVNMGRRCGNSKHRLILALLYSTGIRRSELLDIRLEDIDWADDRIHVRSVKNNKDGFVQLHRTTKKYLLVYLKEWKPRTYLFNGQNSIRYSGASVRNVISHVSDGKYSPHDFRRTYLTNLIEHENVFAAKDMARHSSLRSTLIYYHTPPDKLRLMYNPMDMAFSSPH